MLPFYLYFFINKQVDSYEEYSLQAEVATNAKRDLQQRRGICNEYKEGFAIKKLQPEAGAE